MKRRNENGTFKRINQLWTIDTWEENGYYDKDGRFIVYRPDYPGYKFKSGYAFRFHVVWWLCHGVVHPKGYDLHHKDENKRNDVIDNLELKRHGEHTTLHCKKECKKFICVKCGNEFTMSNRYGKRIRKYCSKKCFEERKCVTL